MTTKAIIFDFWGTLAYTEPPSAFVQIRNELSLKNKYPEVYKFGLEMEKVIMIKSFANPEEEFTELCKKFNVTPDKALVNNLINYWQGAAKRAKLFPETKPVLEDLSSNYKLALISNTDMISAQNVTKLGIADLFDSILFSYKTGILKPNQKILERSLIGLDVKAEECMFVGDNYYHDIKPAIDFGMKAVIINPIKSGDYKPRIDKLNQLKKYL